MTPAQLATLKQYADRDGQIWCIIHSGGATTFHRLDDVRIGRETGITLMRVAFPVRWHYRPRAARNGQGRR